MIKANQHCQRKQKSDYQRASRYIYMYEYPKAIVNDKEDFLLTTGIDTKRERKMMHKKKYNGIQLLMTHLNFISLGVFAFDIGRKVCDQRLVENREQK